MLSQSFSRSKSDFRFWRQIQISPKILLFRANISGHGPKSKNTRCGCWRLNKSLYDSKTVWLQRVWRRGNRFPEKKYSKKKLPNPIQERIRKLFYLRVFYSNVNEVLRLLQKSNLTNDSSFEPSQRADIAKTIDISEKSKSDNIAERNRKLSVFLYCHVFWEISVVFARSARQGGSNELSFVKFDFCRSLR